MSKFVYKNLETGTYAAPFVDAIDIYNATIFSSGELFYSSQGKNQDITYYRIEFNQELRNIRKEKLLKINEKIYL